MRSSTSRHPAAISLAVFGSVAAYAAATTKEPYMRIKKQSRISSATANMGNCVVHVLICLYLFGNSASSDAVIQGEIAAGYAPLVVLAVINLTVGILSLSGTTYLAGLIWNTFVLFAGTLVPAVWPRFFTEGLITWPAILIFLWLGIFACELTACVSSWTWFALLSATGDKMLV